MSLPSADDLFRPTAAQTEASARSASVRAVPDEAAAPAAPEATPQPATPRKPSGRVRHDEKMTVYVTSEELLEIEHARLSLRRAQGLAVDRGRLVREAVSLILADLEANGEQSMLVRRLTEG